MTQSAGVAAHPAGNWQRHGRQNATIPQRLQPRPARANFGVLSACLCPLAAMAGSLTSTVTAEQAAPAVGPWLCPEGTIPHIYTYATTIRDDSGFERPATGYGMDCRDAAGKVVKDVGPTYGFVWVGLLAAASLGLSALFAFLLAAPAGVILARVLGRKAPG